MSKKVRKPRDGIGRIMSPMMNKQWVALRIHAGIEHAITLETAKKLHAWLGKAIQYLEGKK